MNIWIKILLWIAIAIGAYWLFTLIMDKLNGTDNSSAYNFGAGVGNAVAGAVGGVFSPITNPIAQTGTILGSSSYFNGVSDQNIIQPASYPGQLIGDPDIGKPGVYFEGVGAGGDW